MIKRVFVAACGLAVAAVAFASSARADVDQAAVCKAAIGTLMGRDVAGMRTSSEGDGTVGIAYTRQEGGTDWSYRCRIEGNQALWAAVGGRWRTHPQDEKIFFRSVEGGVEITIVYGDGSSSKEVVGMSGEAQAAPEGGTEAPSPTFTAAGPPQTIGPFQVDPARPDVVRLSGRIGPRAALDFRRAMHAAPEASVLVLDSEGGSVQQGLLIADDVFTRGLATVIPQGSVCYSACAYVFLAGRERRAEGELGVHQISENGSSRGDLGSAQVAIADIIDVLSRFETPVEVLRHMFETPVDEMYVFSPDEIARYGLDRKPGAGSPETRRLATPLDDLAIPSEPTPRPGNRRRLAGIESAIEQPDRVAVYLGLDFFGGDLRSLRVGEISECAAACLGMGGACTTFTFNASPARNLDNCYLKGAGGIPDANSVAISGVMLSPVDGSAPRFTIGGIDHRAGVMRDVDLPGGDLSRYPSGDSTANECRLACVQDASCRAFTFVERQRQCWLKGRIGAMRSARGMVSGVKSMTVIAAEDVFEID